MFNLIIFENLRERDKSEAVKELIEDSTPRQEFYLVTSIAAGIATLGLISDSIAVVVGSMMLAPLLYPLSALGLGLAIGNFELIIRSIRTVIFSTIFALTISIVLAFLFSNEVNLIENSILPSIKPSILFSIVAFLSGIAAAFSFAKPHLNISLSGIAIAVALVPPLAAAGIGIANLDIALGVNSIFQFFINLIMIIFANYLIFRFMDFDTREKTAEKAVKDSEDEIKEEIKIAEKNMKEEKEEKEKKK